MSKPLIEVSGLAMRYPTGRMALTDTSLTLNAGELVVILGANGCGKSTLLRCVAGILQPTAGQVHVAGEPMTALAGRPLAEARMALGMVFQNANLVKRRSVIANVLTGTLGRHRNWKTALGLLPKAERPFAQRCLEEVGLGSFAEQRAGTLSGGQAQRVSVARALAQRPLALLADEPVASLDPEASEELMGLLRRLAHEDGLGVLCVLHQPDLARRHADRILGMKGGRVQFDQKPADVQEVDVSSLYTKPAPEALPA
ncbi:phosphonate ABC transporter ATP-binding protein [Acidisoma cellulosilytica]|uniref:Phosphonate ABC transporter ATP-binding protein n=1 Tax=Acidisoma cellulosilyticum TaxID=2802395 RepID=A0A964E3M9_9PROT|nr:phosphonate ABC transporter ATP-binding protein [Acidisoma cellulosilyticum]MCB8880546.1 phosphonate ABC transporter ATP-binding protein [Acidisoma cellulosilyticum]